MAISTGLNWLVAILDPTTANMTEAQWDTYLTNYDGLAEAARAPDDAITGEPSTLGTFENFAQQTTGSIEFTTTDQEANNKSDAGWQNSATTSRGLSISVEGYADETNAAYLYLMDTTAFGSATDVPVVLQLTNHLGDEWHMFCKIDSINLTFGWDEVVNYSASLTSRKRPVNRRMAWNPPV